MMSRVKQRANTQSGLTARQKAIIQMLTQVPTASPVTVSTIADTLHLSSRTVLRDLPAVEQWLTSHEFQFVRKPGVGLVLDERLETRRRILALLENAQVPQAYTKEERRRLILGELLSEKAPLKFYHFTSKYKISDGTLGNDFDVLGEWLQQYGITLIRKPGIGVYTEGKEEQYRQAIANAVYEFLSEEELLNLLSGNRTKEYTALSVDIQKRLFQFIDDETLSGVEQVLLEVEQSLHIQYTDSAYMGVLVHIALAVKRLRNFETIEMDAERLNALQQYPEFSVAQEIGKRIEQVFDLDLPPEELGYITMHCISAQIWISGKKEENFSDSFSIRQLVRGMIEIIQKELGVALGQNEHLMRDLCDHMPSVLHRLQLHVKIKHPQLTVIQQSYADVYQAVQKSVRLLKRQAGVSEIPEGEIAYIAMHICAAIEQKQTTENRIDVVVVCPTGIGTSKLLAVQVSKQFPQIRVRETISAFRIDAQYLQQQGVSLILSTVQLPQELPLPTVCVSPVLTESDKARLRTALAQIQQPHTSGQAIIPTRIPNQTLVKFISRLGEEVLQVLEHIKLKVLPDAESVAELMYVASDLFAKEESARKLIADSLAEREKSGETYISELQMYLLHCRTSGVKHCRFGYIRLQRPLFCNKGEVAGAVVMLVPKDDEFPYAQMMSELSVALLEPGGLWNALKEKEQGEIVVAVEACFMRYYRQIVLQRMGCLI